MLKSKIFTICAFMVIFSLVVPYSSSYSEELETLQMEIKYTNGDRIDAYQTKYVVYQDNEKIPFLENNLDTNPVFILFLKIIDTKLKYLLTEYFQK